MGARGLVIRSSLWIFRLGRYAIALPMYEYFYVIFVIAFARAQVFDVSVLIDFAPVIVDCRLRCVAYAFDAGEVSAVRRGERADYALGRRERVGLLMAR